MNLNKVTLAGRITRDVETRYMPNGKAIAKLGLAVNRTWKSESGEKKEDVTFVDVTAFGKTAEMFAQYFRKGSPIYIEGRLQLEQWDDKNSGQKRTKLSVIADSFQFVGSKQSESAPIPAAGGTDAAAPTEDDDVPF